MQREYFDLVVGHTVAEAARGRTPNPDILCNRCMPRVLLLVRMLKQPCLLYLCMLAT